MAGWDYRKTSKKTMGVVCRPCQASGVQADGSYTQWMTGEGRTSKERQREQVLCSECSKDIEKGSLVTHQQNQHGMKKGGLVPEGDEAARGNKPINYRMTFPAKAGPRT